VKRKACCGSDNESDEVDEKRMEEKKVQERAQRLKELEEEKEAAKLKAAKGKK